MLARSLRLRRSSDINRVYKQGSYIGGKNLNAKVRRSNLPASRLTVVVSKKISKRAVVRNRARRRVSEIIQTIWPRISLGFDIIVTVRTDLSTLSPVQLKNEIENLLQKARLLKSDL